MTKPKLHHSVDNEMSTAGFILPGSDIVAWVDEIVSWQCDDSKLELLVLPNNQGELSSGLFVRLGDEADIVHSPNVIPCYQLQENVFLPRATQLLPELSREELEDLFSSETLYVWYPPTGLVGCDRADRLSVADLLGDLSDALQQDADPKHKANCPLDLLVQQTGVDRDQWQEIEPGVTYSRRLGEVRAKRNPELQVLLKELGGNIGDSGNDLLEELRRRVEEQQESNLQKGPMLPRTVKWLYERLPSGKGEPGWVDKLGEWANRKIEESVRRQRQSADEVLAKLISMLEQDPDRGLEHAIPISDAENGYRGVVEAEVGLTRTRPDFDISRVGNRVGGRGAFISSSGDYFARLRQNYVRLANREIQIGRHRRAAYIYAHLLKDFEAAAKVLRDGQHFSEAALLYEEQLNNPIKAVECWLQAGEYSQAIRIYESLSNFEEVAKLYQRIDQPELAVENWWRAVEKYRQEFKHLDASRILGQHLGLHEEALEELRDLWPGARESAKILESFFLLHAPLERHRQVKEEIIALTNSALDFPTRLELDDVLFNLSARYPNEEVRELAKRESIEGLARSINDLSVKNVESALGRIERYAPDDRLLQNDHRRFVNKIKSAQPMIAPVTRHSALQHARCIELPGDARFCALNARKDELLAVGATSSNIQVVKLDWNSSEVKTALQWSSSMTTLDAFISLVFVSTPQVQWLLHGYGMDCLPEVQTSGNPSGIEFPISGCNSLAPQHHLPRSTGDGTLWALRFDRHQVFAEALGADGSLICSHPIPYNNPEPLNLSRFGVHASRFSYIVVVDDTLYEVGKKGILRTQSYEIPIRRVFGSGPNNKFQMAFGLSNGVLVLNDELRIGETTSLADNIDEPLVAFSQDDLVAIADHKTIELYKAQGSHYLLRGYVARNKTPLAITSDQVQGRFAVLNQDNTVDIYITGYIA